MVEALLKFVNDDLLLGASDPVTSDEEIVINGTVDSLGVVRIVGFIEDEFGISVPAEDVVIEHFRSIDAIAAYLDA